MTTNRFVKLWLIVFSLVFAFYEVTFADDTVLTKLGAIRVSVNVPGDAGPLSFQLRNTLELNLRKAGLRVSSDAAVELRLNVFWVDFDSEQSHIIGKYGIVELSLYEPVRLVRDQGIITPACTWRGSIALFHGPPDSFAVRIRQWASDLTDDFLNRWMSVK